MNPRSEYRFFDRLRVRWAEVDMQKIVFNGHYLMYLDTAIASYWRALAMPYHQAQQEAGEELFVRKAQIEYHDSAGFDDELDIGVRCARLGRSSLHFALAIFRGEEHLIDGDIVYVYADTRARRSLPVPTAWRECIRSREHIAPAE